MNNFIIANLMNEKSMIQNVSYSVSNFSSNFSSFGDKDLNLKNNFNCSIEW
jgi:hypothetical protein